MHSCDCGRTFASARALEAHARRCVAYEQGQASRRVTELLRQAAERAAGSDG